MKQLTKNVWLSVLLTGMLTFFISQSRMDAYLRAGDCTSCVEYVEIKTVESPTTKLVKAPVLDSSKISYPATLVRVIDGDTFVLALQIWEDITLTKTIRLDGVDTPELRPRSGTEEERAQEKVRAASARDYALLFLSCGNLTFEYSWKSDSFGRAIGTVYCQGNDIRNALREQGHLQE